MAQTAGSEWTVSKVGLGGFNGLNSIPTLSVGNFTFTGPSLFYLVLMLLLVVYLGLKKLLRSRSGCGLIALRENRERTEMFGYFWPR
jgi:ABC-type branched-subunit amino acid transport system permease subunit